MWPLPWATLRPVPMGHTETSTMGHNETSTNGPHFDQYQWDNQANEILVPTLLIKLLLFFVGPVLWKRTSIFTGWWFGWGRDRRWWWWWWCPGVSCLSLSPHVTLIACTNPIPCRSVCRVKGIVPWTFWCCISELRCASSVAGTLLKMLI